MPRTAVLVLTLAAAISVPAAPPRAAGVFTALASALSEGDAIGFMRPFDPSMPNVEKLRSDVTAMLARANVLASLFIMSDEGDDTHRAFEVDWVLQIRDKEPTGRTQERKQTVKCKLELRGKKWVITSLEPLGFFAP